MKRAFNMGVGGARGVAAEWTETKQCPCGPLRPLSPLRPLPQGYDDFAGLSVRAHVAVSGCVFIQAGEDTVDGWLQESRC